MNKTTKKLLDKVRDNHDWRSDQCWQWEACGIYQPSVCRICGLRWESYSGGQNSPDRDDFLDHHGNELTLHEAADLPSCVEE